MKKLGEWYGHLACLSAYGIFGINIIVCKDLANSDVISPFGLFSVRAVGASILFWLVSLFMPSEKVDKKDLFKIFMASILGLFLTQTTFLFAITMTTPLDASIVASVSPIFTMLITAIAIKEPITFKKAGGVALSFIGIIMFILNSVGRSSSVTQSSALGIILMICNALSFASYLGIFKPLIQKYTVVTFMKWMFLFSMIISLPFKFGELVSINVSAVSSAYWWELSFLVIFSTFVAYFLIPVGQKRLRPTIISLYSYIQPIIASVVSIMIGMDTLSVKKVFAAAVVITGVVLVNKSRAAVK